MNETAQEMTQRHRREREELEDEERANARAAMQREREERAAEETRQNEAALQARINLAAKDPAGMLAEIKKAGVDLRVDDNDEITATPPGGLGLIFRRAIEQVRPTVITLLRQRQTGEIL